MVAPASQSAPSKSSRRLHAAGKLAALLGLPLALIGTIFGGGLYFGATHSYRMQVLEARYFGFPEPRAATGTPQSQAPESAQAPAEPEQPSVDTRLPETKNDAAPEPRADLVEPRQPQPGPVEPEPTAGLAVAKVEPVGEELRAKFDARREVHLKIMIDPALAAAREDWPNYTNELFTAVRASFSALFGIELRLQGVVVWSAVQDTPLAELGAQLVTHDREGAELILALVARAQPPSYEAPSWTQAVHGDHGLVFAVHERSDPYYHSMLRTLARLFGAQESAELGSFMSPGGSPAGAAPVLDPSNRGQVIFHKQRPFVSRDPASPDTDRDTKEM